MTVENRKLELGTVYDVTDAKSGEGARGAWWLCPVKDPKGFQKMTLFADNVGEIDASWKAVRIQKITSVSVTPRKVGEKWVDQVAVTAILEKAAMEDTFMDVSGVDPFA